jgi:hypothetical protein
MNLWKCILKTFLIMSLMVIFFIFSGCSDPDPRKGLTADSVNVAMSLSNKGLVLFSQDNKPVFLGTFSGVSSPRAVVIRNLTRHQIRIPYWRSPCPCIEFVETPEEIAPGEEVKVTFTVDPASYDGPIFKNLPLICEFADRETTLFIPVGFVAKSAESEPFESTLQTETGKQIEYLEYSPRDAEQYRNAGAWIFAGKNCSECNYLKANFFPQVFPKGTRIVLVDIDNRENLDLLLKLEKKLSIAFPGNAPVLFYKNKLTYGADAIKQLFASRIQ